MIGETEKVIINGLSFEKINGKRNIKSVFLLKEEDGSNVEVPILDDASIDKEKLIKELIENYRKEVIAILDLSNDIGRPESRYTKLGFVGIKK